MRAMSSHCADWVSNTANLIRLLHGAKLSMFQAVATFGFEQGFFLESVVREPVGVYIGLFSPAGLFL